MSDLALRVEGLGKRYRLGLEQGGRFRYKSLRDSVGKLARRPWSVVTGRRRMTDENSFWALDDVSFEVQRGEAVGIIGRNGAGKSTLLKILSQITKPTTGRVELFGRVGSLLEVGTGFHPELTGRENIFLNGAILGMTRSEIRRQFDEIVAFSEIEKFLDTPVKQYSSGMYTRLAFAVAAHLNPEILVVDEVLAVGDAEFQKKCLGKMKDVASHGRTVLFVSHNMGAILALCTSGIVLREGSVCFTGPSAAATAKYHALRHARTCHLPTQPNEHGLSLVDCFLNDEFGQSVTTCLFGSKYTLSVKFRTAKAFHGAGITLRIHNSEGQLVTCICPVAESLGWLSIQREGTLEVAMPFMQMFPGRYTIDVLVHVHGSSQEYLNVESALTFDVEASTLPNATWPYGSHHGEVRLNTTMRWLPTATAASHNA